MSGREWKPGDVALVTEYDPPLLAMVGYREGSKLLMFKYADGGFDVAGRIDIVDGEELEIAARPLVVIDPEDREQIKRLADIGTRIADPRRTGLASDHAIRSLQAALREFANPKPAKPDEPQGLGAVVEDADGTVWLSNRFDSTITWRTPWFSSDLDEWRDWSAIEVARILNDGWVSA